MKKTLSGQITVEAAIVVPVMIMALISVISLGMYIRDAVVIKSVGYRVATDFEKEDMDSCVKEIKSGLKNASLFISGYSIEEKNSFGKSTIIINMKNNSKILWLNKLINFGKNNISIDSEQPISREFMYATEAIVDELE